MVVVDDEDMVLTSVRAFLSLETEYEIQTFLEPERAVEFLRNNLAEVIVSDYLMPGMTGIQFLARARELQPEAPRVLLTGHADKQSAIEAINQVGLFHYLEKPWDNEQLLLIVNNAIERASLFRELKEKIAELSTANSSLKAVQARLLKAFL
ncbi:MAG: response regulator [Candidatus Solibacter usitatus]|nr:response regulator [Candidatus Solibacter usitatus]